MDSKTQKAKSEPDNGVGGLRSMAQIVTVLSVFGFAWAVILAIIGTITWFDLGWFSLYCIGGVCIRFVFLALASIAEAATIYSEKAKQ